MSIGRNEQILRLDVSVGDLQRVKVLECRYDLRDVEQRHVVWKQVFTPQQTEDFAALHILKRKVHMRLVLKRLMPTNFLKSRQLTSSRQRDGRLEKGSVFRV